MSDSPTRSFKDFVGWAFAGLAALVLILVSMMYSSLRADVAALDAASRAHVERITSTETRVDGIKDSLRQIVEELRGVNKRLDDLRKY